jgi:hypothetical protein
MSACTTSILMKRNNKQVVFLKIFISRFLLLSRNNTVRNGKLRKRRWCTDFGVAEQTYSLLNGKISSFLDPNLETSTLVSENNKWLKHFSSN